MKDIAQRFGANPILKPKDLTPSKAGFEITCLLNPGVFRYLNKTWLLVRVAERPIQKSDTLSFPILESEAIKIIEIDKKDPGLDDSDPRVIRYNGIDYLTTLSHLRLLCSDDGIHFYQPDDYHPIFGSTDDETYGIEDCRVAFVDGFFYLSYTAVSAHGVGVALQTTTDWQHFNHHGLIFPPHNKDCAIFEEKIGGKFYCQHRPSSVGLGGNYIWLAESLDGLHWGKHQCILKTRAGKWDSHRVGAGASPIKTPLGWLSIYHGANAKHQYGLGAFLMDLKYPAKVLAQTDQPIMYPSADYELNGFFGEVVFTNGHVVNGDELTIYYGAADEFICGAKFSIAEILSQLIYKT